jgi:uncharacterized membrane protein YgcG
LHANHLLSRRALVWLATLSGALALSLATGAVAHAEESNPNDYECKGHIEKGQPEPGNEEEQVAYEFFCDGPITGYQIESNVEVTTVEGTTLVQNFQKEATSQTFSCSSEIPGWAVNCVGSAAGYYERVSGQFSIETPICTEPRANPLLTVTYAYLEKGVVTQAISGPFELGRPHGCKADAYGGKKRLAPEVLPETKKASTTKSTAGSKAKAKKGKGSKSTSGSKSSSSGTSTSGTSTSGKGSTKAKTSTKS